MMSTPDQSIPNASPSIFRLATLLICAATAVSALPWLFMAVGRFGGFAWGLFGFELIVVLGCVMTILVSMGKIRVAHAFPMAILCLIGTILVGMVFGIHVDARAVVGDHPTIEPWINRTLFFRLGVIVLLSAIATLDMYRRDPRSWGLVFRSAIFLLPVVGAIGWLKINGLPAATSASGEPNPMRMVFILLAGLILGILFSIGGHFLIRSFEVAAPESSDNTD